MEKQDARGRLTLLGEVIEIGEKSSEEIQFWIVSRPYLLNVKKQKFGLQWKLGALKFLGFFI